ncbi:unnamed protein product [Coffea canephora]|uniref:Disease resistance RPP13-like protein 1 n=1 Tax=Coffea canephora TaxID=49390 RepID=A0A068VAI2_COFCA|nr:unnamed protein product [Coffea canephora]
MALIEVFLGAIIKVVFDKLASVDLKKFARSEGLDTQLKRWIQALSLIQAVLDDAEDKQNMRIAVKHWLDDLQDLAYDMDDSMKEQIKILHLVETVAKRPNKTRDRLPSTSLVESYVFGRENDKEELLKLLLSNESKDDRVVLIPIVGMGGVGKTTLAQMVYNDDRVNEFFDSKAWACRFLIVLDDVWNEKYEDWDILRRPFLVGSSGSKIIVTTRNQRVASVVSSTSGYSLEVLTDDESLWLLARHALGRTNFDRYPNLEGIGRSIVRKCKNLPLAVKTLGGLLRDRSTPDEWTDILNSEIWEIKEDQSDILPALRLSYYHLPAHLKPCFAYCSIFPKDYEFDKYELVLLWMAEGFLEESKASDLMEDIGDNYFKELLMRSFFQQSSSTSTSSRFVMHDLINDLARYVAGDFCSRLTDGLEENIKCTILDKVRYASFTCSWYEATQKFKTLQKAKHLRSFLPLPMYESTTSYVAEKVVAELLLELRYSRVLSFSGYAISDLPNSIGELIHLSKVLQQDLLEALRPHTNLTSLEIEFYKGDKFSSWVEDSSFTKLVKVSLRGCTHCKCLPSLGQLPALKDLSIQSMLEVKAIGTDLTFDDMPEWEEWTCHFSSAGENECHFPLLRKLCISGCPKLKSIPVLQLPSLSELNLKKCSVGIAKCFHNLTSLNQLHNLCNLQTLRLRNCRKLINLPVGIRKLINLRHLETFNPSQLHEMPSGIDQLTNLQTLSKVVVGKHGGFRLNDLGNLSLLAGSLAILELQNVTNVQEARDANLKNKRDLDKIVLAWNSEYEGSLSKVLQQDLLEALRPQTNLTSLEIEFYKGDKFSSWVGDSSFTKLVKLCGKDCSWEFSFPSLESLTFDDMPEWEEWTCLSSAGENECHFSSLQKLCISRCPKLKSIPVLHLPSLSELNLKKCSDVFMQFPSGLGDITLRSCHQLKNLWGTSNTMNFGQLKSLVVSNCSQLSSLEELGVLPMLKYLEIKSCSALQSLPTLSGLNRLRISRCSAISCLPMDKSLLLSSCSSPLSFPQGDFPPSLERLDIEAGENLRLKPLSEWGLNRLTFLERFYIRGLTALRYLHIFHCPKLGSLPKESLRNPLQTLQIDECPLLEKRCLMDRGDYWPMIEDIPFVRSENRQ